MVSSHTWHWRALIGLTLLTLAGGFLLPKLAAPPELDEQRVLATLPAPIRGPGDLEDYRNELNAYVADRFPARPYLIGWLNAARMPFGVSGSGKVIVGRDGWLFYDNDTHLGEIRNDPPLGAPTAREAMYYLAGRSEYLQQRGIKYLVVSPPQKEALYPQFAPYWFKASAQRPAMVLPGMARAAQAGEILYLYDFLQGPAKSSGDLFSRHDTHWTGLGAHYGYVGLMNRLKAMGVGEDPRPLSDFEANPVALWGPRDLAMMLGVSSFVKLTYQDHSDKQTEGRLNTIFLGENRAWSGPQVIDTGQAGKPVLMMSRDSFSNALVPFLYGHFSRLILTHNQDGTWREDLINRFHPDVVVLEVIESGIPASLGDGPQPSEAAKARIDAVVKAQFPL